MNRLHRLQRRLLYATGALLLATGVGWALVHYAPTWLGIDERRALGINATLMKVHGAAAMAALVLLGTILFEHVGAGWRAARNKPSGIALLALSVLLVVTAYLLYYSGDEQLRGAASLLHLGAGLAIPAVVLAHVARLMRQRPLRLPRRRPARRASARAPSSPQ